MLTKDDIKKLNMNGRALGRCNMHADGFVSDQNQGIPQPPLAKEQMTDNAVKLPTDFGKLESKSYVDIVNTRQSRRVYTDEALSLTELSFLLWATQGVKSIRGKKYATLRTVPSAGARHPFELYFAAFNIEGLEPGIYHYLPLTHSIEFLKSVENMRGAVADSLDSQIWASKGAVVFYLSFVPYRAEWRYGIFSHKMAYIDAGHVGQAFYMAAEALGLGTCGVGDVRGDLADVLLGLDGEEEFTLYAQPIGRIKASDAAKELEFYAFLKEEDE